MIPKMPAVPQIFYFLLLAILCCLNCSCGDPHYSPKPRTYPRIDFPERKYEVYSRESCPFSFQKPVYAEVLLDSTYFDEKAPSDCWFNLNFPDLNANLFCSYQPLANKMDLEKYINESFRLVREHHIKADYIDEFPYSRDNQVFGVMFNLEGPSASSFQFYVTDSARHFLRGSLYFNTQIRPDSLAPFYEFLKYDILEIVNSLEWKK
jgi:gliding motility-associated lipoprotein GldD